MKKQRLYPIALAGLLLMSGCTTPQIVEEPESITEESIEETTEAVTIEDIVDNIKFYTAQIDVALEASGDFNQNTADLVMNYQTSMSVDLRKNIMNAKSINQMHLEGDAIMLTEDTYQTEAYLETDNTGTRCYTKRIQGDKEGSWVLRDIPDTLITSHQFAEFINIDLIETMDQTEENVYSGDITGDDISFLAEQLNLLEIDGGLLPSEVVAQFQDIHASYAINPETLLPEEVILDCTDTYNETVSSAGEDKVTAFVITISLQYPENIEIIKPNMNDLSTIYTPEEPDAIPVVNSTAKDTETEEIDVETEMLDTTELEDDKE